MSDEKNPLEKYEPPDTEDGWKFLITGAQKSHDVWPIMAFFVALRQNKKAAAAVLMLIGVYNQDPILLWIKSFLGIL